MAHASVRRGQLSGLTAAVLFGCSAPLVSTLTGSGSALSIAWLLCAGASPALLAVRLIQGRAQAETPVQRCLLAWAIDNNLSQRLSLRNPIQIASLKAVGASLPMLGLALLLGEGLRKLTPVSIIQRGCGGTARAC